MVVYTFSISFSVPSQQGFRSRFSRRLPTLSDYLRRYQVGSYITFSPYVVISYSARSSTVDTSPLTMQIPIVVRRKQTKADRPLLGVLHIAGHQIDSIWNLPLLLLGIADRQERLNTHPISVFVTPCEWWYTFPVSICRSSCGGVLSTGQTPSEGRCHVPGI